MSLTQSEILYIKTIMKSKNPSDNEAIEFYNEHKELFINMDSSDIKYIENSRTERGALPKWNESIINLLRLRNNYLKERCI